MATKPKTNTHTITRCIENDFALVLSWKEDGKDGDEGVHWIDFAAYIVVCHVRDTKGFDPKLPPEACLFAKRDATPTERVTTNINDAEVFVTGFIKWDGCSEWHFDEGGYHACGLEQAERVGRIARVLYQEAGNIMGPDCR